MSDDPMRPQVEEEEEPVESGKLSKSEKKRLKKLEEELETGLLSPWDRYRALIDQLKQNTDIIELADRKTRFALVILAAMNAVNVAFVAKPEILLGNAGVGGVWAALYIILYAVISLFLCVQAIWTLKPRLSTRVEDAAVEKTRDLRSWDSVANQNPEQYYEAWHRATYGQINREVAGSIHATSKIVIMKYTALKRLYDGLLVLVFLTACLIVSLTFLRLLR